MLTIFKFGINSMLPIQGIVYPSAYFIFVESLILDSKRSCMVVIAMVNHSDSAKFFVLLMPK